jgi:hypothetical protein
LQFSVVIFWQATGLFALAGLQAAVPPPASCAGRRFRPGVTATRIAGLPLQSLPERAGAKNQFSCNIF